MGNEFGHPEWIDFPREGNNYSYHYCRRQWNLLDDSSLLFECLNNFDIQMNKWEQTFGIMDAEDLFVTLKHEDDKVLVFEKAGLLFAFNFHPSKSFESYRIGTQWSSDHIILFDTDQEDQGGYARLAPGKKSRFVPQKGLWQARNNSIKIYLPNRTCIIFIAEEKLTENLGIIMPPITKHSQLTENSQTKTSNVQNVATASNMSNIETEISPVKITQVKTEAADLEESKVQND